MMLLKVTIQQHSEKKIFWRFGGIYASSIFLTGKLCIFGQSPFPAEVTKNRFSQNFATISPLQFIYLLCLVLASKF